MDLTRIEKATGISWKGWLSFFSKINAIELNHTEIARLVEKQLGSNTKSAAWWAQTVTVEYEKHIGRRITGQTKDGTFQTSISKVTKKGMKQLMDKWIDFAATRKEIANLIIDKPSIAGTAKRLTWRIRTADKTTILVTSEPRGKNAALIISLMGFISKDSISRAKLFWQERMNEFVENHSQDF